MKRLLTYLFLIICLGLVFTNSSNAAITIVKENTNILNYNCKYKSVDKKYPFSSKLQKRFKNGVKVYFEDEKYTLFGSENDPSFYYGFTYFNHQTLEIGHMKSDFHSKIKGKSITNSLISKYSFPAHAQCNGADLEIAKKEPSQTQQVAEQATTTLKPIKKIVQLKKVSKKETPQVAEKEKKTIATEVMKRKPSKCNDKKLTKKKCKEFEKMERKVTVETVMALGTFKEFNDYPEGMLKEFGNCKKQLCKGKKAGEKVYEYFVRRGKLWHERHPGDMIYGMAWFEIMYLEKLRKNKKEIARFINDDYGSSTLTRKKKEDIKALHSLIKMNEGKIKMRKALGLSADDSLATVLGSHWLLGDFLNNNTFKVSKVSLDPRLKKRKKLLAKYQAAIRKYKAKLKEGKEG